MTRLTPMDSYRAVLSAAPDAMVIADASGRMRLVNPETERLFGYTEAELIGQRVEILVPARLRDAHVQHRATYADNPHTRPMGAGLELSGRRKDGTVFPVEISLSPMVVGDAQLVMAAIRDVSARKRIEAALRRANADLESFTYSVSHDLRAPIRKIDGFARLLQEDLGAEADERALHHLDRIVTATQHMARLVDDLLTLTQVGPRRAVLKPVDLNTVVASVVQDAKQGLVGRTVEWRIGALPTVECDPGLMHIVFTNLVGNAVKYTRPRREATIEIGTKVVRGARAFYVRDNGVGFDMKYADRLFGVFQRLHDADAFEGTGVGLATVQRIVRKHGGEIWAEAAPDQGATFTFTLATDPRPDDGVA